MRKLPTSMGLSIFYSCTAASICVVAATSAVANDSVTGRIAAKYSEAARLDEPSVVAAMAAPAPASAVPLTQDDAPQAAVVTIRGMRVRQMRLLPRGGAYGYGAPDPMVADVGYRYRVDPKLLAAIMHAESGGRAGAISPKGALGLMQVMPATARGMGVANPRAMLTDRGLALTTGARYLKHLQAQLGNDVPLVVAAYNAGPGAVFKAGGRVPRYRETQGYVRQVVGRYVASRARR